MAVVREPEAPLALFEVRFLCGGEPGARQVWAPTAADASRCLRDRPSLFGMAHETVLVLRVIELDVKEEGLDAAA